MAIKAKSHYQARARIAKALAHPTRLLLLDALGGKELCVGELTELAEADQSTVSKHLAILRDAGFLEMDKRGANSFYSVRCPCLDQFFGCFESVLRQRLEAHQESIG